MTYRQWMTRRQLLTEEFIGRFMRQPASLEDEAFKAGLSKMPRS